MTRFGPPPPGFEGVWASAENLATVELNAVACRSVSDEGNESDYGTSANLSKKSELSSLSEVSGSSASCFANPAWSREERDLFDERAAIIEFEGGVLRSQAEYLARRFIDNARRCPSQACAE